MFCNSVIKMEHGTILILLKSKILSSCKRRITSHEIRLNGFTRQHL